MTLSPRASQLYAVLILMAAIALLSLAVIMPLAGLYSAGHEKLALLTARARHIAARSEDVPALKQKLAGLRQAENAATPFWPGDTDAVAAAGLQEHVKEILKREDAVIDSTEVLSSADDKDGLRRIALKVRFQAEIDQLQRAVHAIETMSPALMVDSLTVRSVNSPREGAAPLAVELTVFGIAEPLTSGRPSS